MYAFLPCLLFQFLAHVGSLSCCRSRVSAGNLLVMEGGILGRPDPAGPGSAPATCIELSNAAKAAGYYWHRAVALHAM